MRQIVSAEREQIPNVKALLTGHEVYRSDFPQSAKSGRDRPRN